MTAGAALAGRMVRNGDAPTGLSETGVKGGSGKLHLDWLLLIFQWAPMDEFFRVLAACCREFSPEWYLRSFRCQIVVPDEAPTINRAINLLASAPGRGSTGGLVLVRPGVYRESVRVTQNCHLLGLGPRGAAVVEAPGWESALVFAGLGVRTFGSGEDASVLNLTFRCRNESMRGRCVYIVMGRTHLAACDIEGGVVVNGRCTAPSLERCRVRGARGSGLHLSDHCRPEMRSSVVANHGRHGVLVDRGSQPTLALNCIRGNGACGIRAFAGSGAGALHLGGLRDNDFQGNCGGDLRVSPRAFSDTEEASPAELELGELHDCC